MDEDMWAPAQVTEDEPVPEKLSPDSPALCLVSTPTPPKEIKPLREPNFNDAMDVAMFGHLIQGYEKQDASGKVKIHLAEMYFTTPFVGCPSCTLEVSKLYDEKRCFNCFRQEDIDSKKQERLGLYLKKTIGQYGIERYSFGAFKQEFGNMHAYNACLDFDVEKNNIILLGSCGTGKTHLAGAVMKKVAGQNHSVMWANPMFINRMFRMRTPEEEEERLEQLANCPLLVIDDLGVGKDTEFTLRIIYELLERRNARKRCGLLVTSNLLLDDLAKKFGDDRLTSRMNGSCSIYQIEGRDYRSKED